MAPILRVAAILLVVGAVCVLSSCYVTTQGYHLLRTQARATPIDRLRDGGNLTPEENGFFSEVESIRRFATDRLGLAASRNYTRYVSTERDHLVDVVSAARATSFERKEWWFPLFGRFPYKGFYRSEPAQRLARRLHEDGWDVIVRPVGAFSTLGFFRDPLFTYMKEYGEARLAEMIIHEMAHATLWVSSEGQFNEEFASFVGLRGSEQYLVERYGEESVQVETLRAARRDQERFRRDVADLRERLEALYTTESEVDRILSRKEEIIREFRREFMATHEERYESDRYRFIADQRINNAWIDLFHTYTGNLDAFEALHERMNRDLAATIAEIRERVATWEDTPRGERPPIAEILSIAEPG